MAKQSAVDHLLAGRVVCKFPINGRGPEIRTPKSVTRSWISSSYGSCPHHVVIGCHRYLSCLCEARAPGRKQLAGQGLVVALVDAERGGIAQLSNEPRACD